MKPEDMSSRITPVLVLALLGCGCGPESFTLARLVIEGGADDAQVADEASALDSGPELDASAPDTSAPDTGTSDASTPDTGVCTSGATACQQTWDAFCSRLKTCCAGQCAYAWANNGGADCTNHYLGSPSYCTTSRASDKRCDEKCVADIQIASCPFVTSQASIYGVSGISSACMAFWQ